MKKCPKCGYTQNHNLDVICRNCNNPLPQPPIEFKNKWIALIMSLLVGFITSFSGAGQLYLGNYKRFGIEAGISLILTLIGNYTYIVMQIQEGLIFGIIAFIWWIYTSIDTYLCAESMNRAVPLPKLLGQDIN